VTEQKRQRNPPCRDEELILAMDLYIRRGIVSKEDPEIEELSQLLNSLGTTRQSNGLYRNANSVHMKLSNFRARDKQGGGLQHGNRREQVVWDKFRGRNDLLAAEVRLIRQRARK
jgi:hypothetical protein